MRARGLIALGSDIDAKCIRSAEHNAQLGGYDPASYSFVEGDFDEVRPEGAIAHRLHQHHQSHQAIKLTAMCCDDEGGAEGSARCGGGDEPALRGPAAAAGPVAAGPISAVRAHARAA